MSYGISMVIKTSVYKIVFLVIYIAVGIPLITTFLLPMAIDFVNYYGDVLKIEYAVNRYVYNSTSGQFEYIPEVLVLDLRGLVVWLIQITVYIIIPLLMILSLKR